MRRMDVGVIERIDYRYSPRGAAIGYARHLKWYGEDEFWKMDAGGDVIVEIEYETTVFQAMDYITASGLASAEAHQVMRWVRTLPWRDDGMVMLHLG